MEELLQKMYAEMEAVKTNAQLQHEHGNKAAGMRARKASLNLEKLLKEFRKASLAASNAGK
jgi:hypothetical protein